MATSGHIHTHVHNAVLLLAASVQLAQAHPNKVGMYFHSTHHTVSGNFQKQIPLEFYTIILYPTYVSRDNRVSLYSHLHFGSLALGEEGLCIYIMISGTSITSSHLLKQLCTQPKDVEYATKNI